MKKSKQPTRLKVSDKIAYNYPEYLSWTEDMMLAAFDVERKEQYIEYFVSYDHDDHNLYLKGVRLENDAEFNRRLKIEEEQHAKKLKTEQQIREKELKELERLKKKYEK